MFSRLKRSLVESYVGALALGLIFAYATLDFVSIFTASVTYWVARTEYRTATMHDSSNVWLQPSLPYLLASPALFLLGYLLLRWLYFTPVVEPSEPVTNPD